LSHKLAIYDSIYIALSERLACQLVTVDQKQALVASSEGIMLKMITDFTM